MTQYPLSSRFNLIQLLHEEIRRSASSRYDHRLHSVFLVISGMSCREAGRLFGDSPRSVQLWVKRFETAGASGLSEMSRPGRPARLTVCARFDLESALKRNPREFGILSTIWTAKTISTYLQRHWEIQLGLRQCQRLLRKLQNNRKSAPLPVSQFQSPCQPPRLESPPSVDKSL